MLRCNLILSCIFILFKGLEKIFGLIGILVFFIIVGLYSELLLKLGDCCLIKVVGE